MLILFAVLLTCTFGAAEVVTETDTECDYSTMFDQCGIHQVFESTDNLTSLPTEEFFQANCRLYQDALPCYIDYVNRCEDGNTLYTFKAEFEGYLALTNFACDETSSLREGYLENVNCYNSILKKYATCIEDLGKILKLFRAEETKMHPDTEELIRHKIHCMRTLIIPNCYVRETADSCGIGAASTLSQIINIGFQPIRESVCTKAECEIYSDEFLRYLVDHGEEIKKSVEDVRIP